MRAEIRLVMSIFHIIRFLARERRILNIFSKLFFFMDLFLLSDLLVFRESGIKTDQLDQFF